MNEIQVGRYNAILHKLLAMQEGAPSPLLAPEIFPVIQLEHDRPEWAFLGGEKLCVGQISEAALVANYSYVYITNPVGSGTLVVIERILSSEADNTHYFGSGLGIAPTAFGAQIDSRSGIFPTAIASTAGFDSGTAVARPGSLLTFIWMLRGVAMDMFPVVLIPGAFLAIAGNVVNRGVNISFYWRERTLEPSESR